MLDAMLDAMARSDGTRRSVTRALFATCVHNGILGSFYVNGDPTATPITSVQELDTSGTQVVETINAAQSLIR
jgi:hypothetical protein